MSGYDYADHIGQPMSSFVSYDGGRGTRTYVSRIEERVERVRRPSVVGYSYSSAMKAEKERRPKEVDDFLTKILDEVNGPSVSTTRRVDATSDYGVGYQFGVDSPTKVDGGRGYYEVEYVYVGSPMESRISRKYGDPYDQQGLPSHGYDQPSQRSSDNFRLMSEALKNREFPKNQWVKLSSPSYDATPNNPPHVESHASKGREVKPESPRYDGVPNNRWNKDPVYNPPPQRDYGVPNQPLDNSRVTQTPRDYEESKNGWGKSPRPTYEGAPSNPPSVVSLSLKSDEVNPESPRDGVRNNQWGKQSSPVYDYSTRRDYGDPDHRWINSSVKPQSPKDHKGSDNQWSRPLKPTYDQAPNGRYVDIQPGNSPVRPVSSDGYGTLNNQKDRSASPEYDHPPRNEIISGVPNTQWGNSHVRPVYDQTPSNGDHMGAIGRQRDHSSPNPQSPKVYGISDNQGGRSSSPNYDHQPQSKVLGGGTKNWGNSPLKPTFDQASSNDNDSGPPKGLQRYSSMKPQSPRGYGAPGNQMGGSQTPDYENLSQNGMLSGAPKTRLGDSPVRTQSPRDHGIRGNQWGKPSSPVYNNDSPQNVNQEEKHGFPKGYEVPNETKGRSTSPGYEHPPRYEIVVPPALKVRIPQNTGIADGAENKQGSNTPVKGRSPVYDHSLPNAYSEQQAEQPNVAVRPTVPGVHNKPNVGSNTYGLDPKGNKYSQSNKPLGHSYA